MGAELDRERADLERADLERADLERARLGISAGRARIGRQAVVVAEARRRRSDTVQAERLLQTLRGTLQAWERHRDLVMARIAHLERQERLPPSEMKARLAP